MEITCLSPWSAKCSLCRELDDHGQTPQFLCILSARKPLIVGVVWVEH